MKHTNTDAGPVETLHGMYVVVYTELKKLGVGSSMCLSEKRLLTYIHMHIYIYITRRYSNILVTLFWDGNKTSRGTPSKTPQRCRCSLH